MTYSFSFVHFVLMGTIIFFLFSAVDAILYAVVLVTAMMILIMKKSIGVCIDFADKIEGV